MQNILLITEFMTSLVTIYSCSKMTQGDCSWCKNFEVFQQELNCRWCNTPLRCEYRDHCQAQRSVSMCPPPLVEKASFITSISMFEIYIQMFKSFKKT